MSDKPLIDALVATARALGSSITAWCNGSVVRMPATTISLSARRMRAMASGRDGACTTSLATRLS